VKVQSALQQLGLQKVDHPDELHAAYRRMVKRWHPDQFAEQPEIRSMAEERLKQINIAYTALNQYIKKKGITNCCFNKKRSTEKKCHRAPTGDTVGEQVRLRDWFRDAIVRKTHKSWRSKVTAEPQKRTKKSPEAERSGFERIFKKTCTAPKRVLNNSPRITRRVMPVNDYRRRSNSSRVGGLRPVSPIRPIRPVSGIDSINDSE